MSSLTEIVPASLAQAHGDDIDAFLGERYATAPGPFVRLNMITSLTGAAAGADGTSDTLTSRLDRKLLGVIRRQAEVVIVGAASVRAEGYVVPKHATLAVVTTSGDLSGHALSEGAERVLILCPAARVAQVAASSPDGATVIGLDPEVTPPTVLAALAQRGLTRVVCEGGPRLASQFAAAGVIDEYCLTLTPALTPAQHPFLTLEHAIDVTVAGQLVDDAGFSYFRLRPRG